MIRIAVVMIVLFPILLSAQVDTAWVRRYDGSSHYNDNANALALDSAGNAYVTGGADLIAPLNHSYLTIKYNPSGDTQWTRAWGGGDRTSWWGCCIEVDLNGNIVVAGKRKRWVGVEYAVDICTITYAPNGSTNWSQGHSGTLNYDGWPVSLAVGRIGDVHVAATYGYLTQYLTIKYSPQGGGLWARMFGSYDYGTSSLAADSLGNVYVTGSNSGYNIWTLKYNSVGDTIWARRYGPASSYALALDAAGYIYVAGTSGGDYATIKYNSSGDTLWVRHYDGTGNRTDVAKCVAVDGAGNVYVTGTSQDSSSQYDFATIKYSSDGVEQWVRRCPGTYGGPADIALDNAANVYITGSISTGSTTDYVTIKYDSAGTLQWSIQYDGPAGGNDNARAIAVDGTGNVYVTGESYGIGTYQDYATIKYVQAGGVEEEKVEAKCQKQEARLRVKPNPFRNSCDIRFTMQDAQYQRISAKSQEPEAKLQIFDVSGRVVRSFPITNNQAPISIRCNACGPQGAALPAGVYFVQLKCGGLTHTARVVLID